MKILHMMVGLPRSGKSTAARNMPHPIVSPDAIRLALHGTAWRAESEPMVWAIAHTMVTALFRAGHGDVTLDACNVSLERCREWESPEWVLCYHVVDTPADVCIERAEGEGRYDLVSVIKRMAASWFAPGMGKDC